MTSFDIVSWNPTLHCQVLYEALVNQEYVIKLILSWSKIFILILTSLFLGAQDLVFTFSILALPLTLCTQVDFTKIIIKIRIR
jgi:hypothetical protein